MTPLQTFMAEWKQAESSIQTAAAADRLAFAIQQQRPPRRIEVTFDASFGLFTFENTGSGAFVELSCTAEDVKDLVEMIADCGGQAVYLGLPARAPGP